MQTVVGIFTSRAAAEQAIAHIHALGIPLEHLHLLTPDTATEDLVKAPVPSEESTGLGKAIGGTIGGIMGASGGMFGAAFASVVLPGIGMVTAIGMVAVAIMGLFGGTLVGVAAGEGLEHFFAQDVPHDELFIYKNALQQGRSIIIVQSDDSTLSESARQVLLREGAQSLEEVRQNWWLNLREAEEAAYTAHGDSFSQDEPLYRRGYEAALHPDIAGKPYDAATTYLEHHYGSAYKQEAFRRGYMRGQAQAVG
ncbi:MAG: hypothetical protein AB7N91_20345 [Candidatus Tectimicrobiota bacterium]